MMQKISGVLFVLLAVPIFFAPALALAQRDTNDGLVSCNPQIVKDDVGNIIRIDQPCKICDLFQTAKRVFNFAMMLAGALATVMIAWGGFLIMVDMGSEARVKKGKEIMWAAVIGLVIALAAWLIIAELMHVLNTGNPTATPWNELAC